MSDIYLDLLEGFKEIGEIEGNVELVDKANQYISTISNTVEDIGSSTDDSYQKK